MLSLLVLSLIIAGCSNKAINKNEKTSAITSAIAIEYGEKWHDMVKKDLSHLKDKKPSTLCMIAADHELRKITKEQYSKLEWNVGDAVLYCIEKLKSEYAEKIK